MDAVGMLKKGSEGVGYQLSEQEIRAFAGVGGIMTFPSAAVYMAAKVIEKALSEHAEALAKATKATEEATKATAAHTKGYKWATIALVFATIMLVVFTFCMWMWPK